MIEEQWELEATDEPASLIDAEWQERADAIQFSALSDIRAAAQKWTATIASVTGVFSVVALVKGPQDVSALRQGFFVAAGILIALAVLCALAAIVLGALAAQGTPKEVWTSGAALREFEMEEQRAASDQLSLSRRCAILAVVPLAIAVGITWYGPKDQRVHMVVESDRGLTKCSEIEVDGSDVSLRQMANVVAIRAVSKCPVQDGAE